MICIIPEARKNLQQNKSALERILDLALKYPCIRSISPDGAKREEIGLFEIFLPGVVSLNLLKNLIIYIFLILRMY
jgi:hypothetical protein